MFEFLISRLWLVPAIAVRIQAVTLPPRPRGTNVDEWSLWIVVVLRLAGINADYYGNGEMGAVAVGLMKKYPENKVRVKLNVIAIHAGDVKCGMRPLHPNYEDDKVSHEGVEQFSVMLK